MAICDSRYRFLTVDIGFKGSDSDGGIWESSGFKDLIENGTSDTIYNNVYQASLKGQHLIMCV